MSEHHKPFLRGPQAVPEEAPTAVAKVIPHSAGARMEETDPTTTDTTPPDPDRDVEAARELGEARRVLMGEIGKRIVGQHEVRRAPADRPVRARPLPVRGRARAGQDAADPHPGRRAQPVASAASSSRPDLMPSDITGTDVLEEDRTTGRRVFRFVHGPAVRQRHPGRRGEPHPAQDPGGAARSRCRSTGSPPAGRPTACRCPSWCSPPRTRSSRRAPTRCPRRSWTASCSRSTWATPREEEEVQIVSQTTGGLPPGPAQGAVARAHPRAAGPGAAGAGGRPRAALRGGAVPGHPPARTQPDGRRVAGQGFSELECAVRLLGRRPARLQYLILAAKARAMLQGRFAAAHRGRAGAGARRCCATGWSPTSTPRPRASPRGPSSITWSSRSNRSDEAGASPWQPTTSPRSRAPSAGPGRAGQPGQPVGAGAGDRRGRLRGHAPQPARRHLDGVHRAQGVRPRRRDPAHRLEGGTAGSTATTSSASRTRPRCAPSWWWTPRPRWATGGGG